MNRKMTMTATLDQEGRIVVPAEALAEAGLSGCEEFAVAVDSDTGALTLTAVTPDLDESWTLEPEFVERLNRAREDSRLGRVYRLTEAQILELLSNGDA